MSLRGKATLIAVGDICLGDHPVVVGWGVRSLAETRGFDFLFDGVRNILKEGDITFGNLECVLSDKGLREGYLPSIEMRGSPQAVKALVKAGFNALNVANNHIMQHGEKAFWETVKVLNENNIKVIGLSRKDCSCSLQIFQFNGLKIAFLGYAFESDRYYKNHLPYCSALEADICLDVKKAREKADIVICSFHWGCEFVDQPSPKEIDIAHKVIDSGANVILGHHPHVLRDIQIYNDGVIAYSLGNFVSDMIWDEQLRHSIILKLKLTSSCIYDIKLIPVFIDRYYRPIIVDHAENKIYLRNSMDSLPEREYAISYKRLRRKYSLKSYKYLLINFGRYSLIILLQILLRAVIRKILEFLKVGLAI